MYQRLIGDFDRQQADARLQTLGENDLERQQARSKRLRDWQQLTNRYPACDEDILYQVFGSVQYSYSGTLAALEAMGIYPGPEHVVDSDPKPIKADNELLESLLGCELARQYPQTDTAVRLEVLNQSNGDYDRAVSLLKKKGFERQTNYAAAQVNFVNEPPSAPTPTQDNVPTGDLIQF